MITCCNGVRYASASAKYCARVSLTYGKLCTGSKSLHNTCGNSRRPSSWIPGVLLVSINNATFGARTCSNSIVQCKNWFSIFTRFRSPSHDPEGLFQPTTFQAWWCYEICTVKLSNPNVSLLSWGSELSFIVQIGCNRRLRRQAHLNCCSRGKSLLQIALSGGKLESLKSGFETWKQSSAWKCQKNQLLDICL